MTNITLACANGQAPSPHKLTFCYEHSQLAAHIITKIGESFDLENPKPITVQFREGFHAFDIAFDCLWQYRYHAMDARWHHGDFVLDCGGIRFSYEIVFADPEDIPLAQDCLRLIA